MKCLKQSRGNMEHLETIKKLTDNHIDYIICADLIYLDETFEDLITTLSVLSQLNKP